MKPSAFVYRRPAGIEEALELLRQHPDDARVIAGGQSLVPVLNLRLAAPGWLIDLNRIAELAGIRGWTEGNLVVKEWPLEAVVAEMNRYSDTKLRLGDPALGRVPISGVFKAGDQQSLVLALEYGWSFRVDPRPDAGEIVLSRQ